MYQPLSSFVRSLISFKNSKCQNLSCLFLQSNLNSGVSFSDGSRRTAYHSAKNIGDLGHNELHKGVSMNTDASLEKNLVFNKNADTFGTLSSDRLTRRHVEDGDDENDDSVTEINYVDGVEGKTRYKPINYAMMIKEHLNKNNLAEALAVLDKVMLQEHRAKPDLYIFNLLISGCAHHGYTKKAFKLFNQMKKRGIVPRLSTYTSLFNACANGPWDNDSLERARHLRELMLEKGVQPNAINYNSMIKAFGRHGDLETSFSIMDEMISKNIAIDSVTFNFLLQAVLSDKKTGFRHALLVWRKMLEKKILPTIFTFNLLLRTVRDCGTGDLESSQELLSMLSSSELALIGGIEDTPLKINEKLEMPNMLLPSPQQGSLVALSSKLQKPWHRLMLLGSTEGILSTIDKCKASPDIKTFALLLDLLPPSDTLEENLLKEMKRRCIKPDVGFFNMLIKKRNSSARFSSAMDVLDLMKVERVVPNIMTFGVLAMGCNTYESSKKLVKDIDELGYRVNNHILTVFLNRAKVSLNIDMVMFTIHTLLSEVGSPDIKFYNQLKYFRDAVFDHFDRKKNGESYIKHIDTPGFSEKFSKFLNLAEKLEDKIKDPSAVHPWEQYKISKKT